MRIKIDCEEGFEVKETDNGLDVYKDGDFLLELEGYYFSDFKDEWCNIDELELRDAIREEVELQRSLEKLEEKKK
jgi:hypothetical protein